MLEVPLPVDPDHRLRAFCCTSFSRYEGLRLPPRSDRRGCLSRISSGRVVSRGGPNTRSSCAVPTDDCPSCRSLCCLVDGCATIVLVPLSLASIGTTALFFWLSYPVLFCIWPFSLDLFTRLPWPVSSMCRSRRSSFTEVRNNDALSLPAMMEPAHFHRNAVFTFPAYTNPGRNSCDSLSRVSPPTPRRASPTLGSYDHGQDYVGLGRVIPSGISQFSMLLFLPLLYFLDVTGCRHLFPVVPQGPEDFSGTLSFFSCVLACSS